VAQPHGEDGGEDIRGEVFVGHGVALGAVWMTVKNLL
jgi:hypothetical protein